MTDKLSRIILTISFLGIFMACNSQKKSTTQKEDWNIFAENSGFINKESAIIKDESTWVKMQEKLFANQNPAPAYMPINFSKENLVLIAMGEKSTGGYSYSLESYEDLGDTISVVLSTPYREPLGPVTMSLTQPVVIFSIPKTKATTVVYKIHEVK